MGKITRGTMKIKYLLKLFLILGMFFALTSPALAQTADYNVHLRRNFGYGGGTNIRGTFTISLIGDESQVDSATFLIDGEAMIVIESAPFSYKFQTDDYGFGVHTLAAAVTLKDGSELITPALQYNFVSPEFERETITKMVGGVFVGILVVLIIFALIQFMVFRGKGKPHRQPGEPRQYGMFGGTICPKCGRPFSRHFWGINLLVGRLDRCENCGKWVMTTRATPSALQQAEEAEQSAFAADQEISKARPDKKDHLEDTRYIDSL